ncbi:hypothetical protein B0J13DRAFT_124570 [Dactylonectria estremocensis]|uniref:Uncharacterized protein n=1 Tax=Dactylonectria estremocensis TaxID=1079267 RepID=A0A9P9FC84_9HYPO|nr:hypothetical protein B0J13DRAFT_124570 [Dactylonectria estremocensis]
MQSDTKLHTSSLCPISVLFAAGRSPLRGAPFTPREYPRRCHSLNSSSHPHAGDIPLTWPFTAPIGPPFTLGKHGGLSENLRPRAARSAGALVATGLFCRPFFFIRSAPAPVLRPICAWSGWDFCRQASAHGGRGEHGRLTCPTYHDQRQHVLPIEKPGCECEVVM